MNNLLDIIKVRQVFCDVRKHRQIEQQIRRFSSNKEDIHIIALQKVDAFRCRRVLDMGCAFGAFTETLKGRLHPSAHVTGLDIVPEYKSFFLETCAHAGYSGEFSSEGAQQISKFAAESFDLIICSYALYFFVDIIPDIARILKPDGVFIAITHSRRNMQELISASKSLLIKNKMLPFDVLLPAEVLTQQFSAENGRLLLSPHFRQIEQIDFYNNLILQRQEIEFLTDYCKFKKPFFLTDTSIFPQDFIDQLREELSNRASGQKKLTLCKDDEIFICSQPTKKGE